MNDEQQFMNLMTAHKGIIHKVLSVYAPVTEQDDLKQDILGAAWKSYKTFRGEAKFSTWLYRIAKNTVVTKLRKIRSVVKTVPFDNPFYQIIAESHVDRDYGIMRNLEFLHTIRVKHVFNHLTDKDTDLIVLYASGYSYEEMEEILGENANNLRVRVSRIKERLNKQFANRPISIYDERN